MQNFKNRCNSELYVCFHGMQWSLILKINISCGGRGLYDAKVVGADDGCAKVVMCNDFGYGWRWGWCGDDGLGGG